MQVVQTIAKRVKYIVLWYPDSSRPARHKAKPSYAELSRMWRLVQVRLEALCNALRSWVSEDAVTLPDMYDRKLLGDHIWAASASRFAFLKKHISILGRCCFVFLSLVSRATGLLLVHARSLMNVPNPFASWFHHSRSKRSFITYRDNCGAVVHAAR